MTINYKGFQVEALGEGLKGGKWQAQWRIGKPKKNGIEGIKGMIISEPLFDTEKEAENYAFNDARKYIDTNL